MVNKFTRYELVGIVGSRTVHGSRSGAPSDGEMTVWGKVKRVDIVTRYYPTKKGWLLLDIRKAMQVGSHNKRFWVGQQRGERVYPSMDAAIMHAIAILAG